MNENEKPLSQPFWTPAMVALVVVNVVFLAMIAVGVLLVFKELHQPVQAWIQARMGL